MSNPEATAGPASDKAHVLAEVPLLQNPEIKGKGFGPMYSFMRFVGERSIAHFFRRIMVVGGEDIPQKGTFILCCTHFATLMDVAIISAELPHRRPIHYWAKKGLYKRQPFRWILENSGNIQVDRKEKNNAMLFAGTFQAMEAGEPIGLFPEGGSFTEPRLHAMKAGAAWAALEYAKHLVVRGAAEPGKTNVLIVPATINYTDKSRFRSEAIFEFGQAFTVDQYTEEFLKTVESEDGDGKQASNGASHLSLPSNGLMSGTSGDESNAQRAPLLSAAMIAKRASKAPSNSASARQAVHRLTDRIGEELYKMTIDAPDWTTWHSIKMARELIWKRNGELPLRNLVKISNALVALLNAPIPKAKLANETLCALQGLVCASSTDVHTLNVMARLFSLPRRAMQPSDQQGADFTLPTRKRSERAVPSIVPALLFLLRQIIFLAVRLPYVLPLAIVYAPAYSIGWYLAKKYSSHEEESMSSSKSLCAFVIAGLTHILIIVLVSAPFLFTPVGWILGLGLCVLIEKTHVYFLDETYGCVKKLVIAWRMVLASVSLWIGGNHRGQLGSENARVRLAVDVVKSAPGIQWSFVKALRHEAHEAKLSTNRQRSGSFTASEGGQSDAQDSSVIPPNIRPKIFNRSGRPACYRLMGVTRLVHAQAVQALHDLLEEFELLDRQYDAKPSGNNDVDLDTIEKYRYIRQEMQKSGVSVMPRSRRYLIGRRKAQ